MKNFISDSVVGIVFVGIFLLIASLVTAMWNLVMPIFGLPKMEVWSMIILVLLIKILLYIPDLSRKGDQQ